MATTDRAVGVADPLRLDIWPHRSLDRGGTLALLGAVAVGLVLVALCNAGPPFRLVGAGCVAAFAGLAAALWINNRAARVHEAIEIDPQRVRVLRRHPAGRVEACEFCTAFVRVELASDRRTHHRLVLAERGKAISLGEFLSPAERKGLGAELQRAIARARRCC